MIPDRPAPSTYRNARNARRPPTENASNDAKPSSADVFVESGRQFGTAPRIRKLGEITRTEREAREEDATDKDQHGKSDLARGGHRSCWQLLRGEAPKERKECRGGTAVHRDRRFQRGLPCFRNCLELFHLPIVLKR